jgi:riboflavin biosynthesis pyrimidine reductase
VILRELLPDAGTVVDLDAPDASEQLAALYAPPRSDWLRLNLVTSVGGSAVGADSTSESLTNPVDRAILRTIRSIADVVLVGAASVRAEGYFVPRTSALAIVTTSGNLGDHRITVTGKRGALLVLCPASATDAVLASTAGLPVEIVVVRDHDGTLSPADIVAALHAREFTSIACEGGPRLAAQLLAAGLVDEVCLSTSPQLGGPVVPLFGTGESEPQRLELRQLLTDGESGLYARWALAAGSARQ